MMSWAQADMKRGFFVQIFFLLPARIRAMRFVCSRIPNIINTYITYCTGAIFKLSAFSISTQLP